jgi:uncharacterized protein (TIGR00255 family)
MTGFGQSKIEYENFYISVEIRSVNHRYLDFHIRMPHQFMQLEDKIKKICQQYVSRGRVDCYVNIEGSGLVKRKLAIDWNLIDEYYQYITNLKDRFQINGNIQLSDLLQRNELIEIVEKELDNEELDQAILQAVEEAVQNLTNMRIIEGQVLKQQLDQNIVQMKDQLKKINDLIPVVQKEYEERLTKRISEYTEGLIDDSRVLTEIAIFSERSDITEELTRLQSHVQQFQSTFELKGPVGRKFDFLVQEMNREVNTIGSKSNSIEISQSVVELKTIIEKIREQVQNIE